MITLTPIADNPSKFTITYSKDVNAEILEDLHSYASNEDTAYEVARLVADVMYLQLAARFIKYQKDGKLDELKGESV